MVKRVRSPNYPALSLPEALQKVRMIYEAQHTHGAPRDVVVKSMGYAGINGASATAISALHKYGLLEGRGDEVRVSERAMRYLNPLDAAERGAAIREAAAEPALFNELQERFPGRFPSEEVLRSYLIRNGFGPSAVSGVILAYRDTIELVEREGGAYESVEAELQEAPSMNMHSTMTPTRTPAQTRVQALGITADERAIVQYEFEGGAYLRIVVGGEIDTEAALEMATTLIGLKRAEIKARTSRDAPTVAVVTLSSDDIDNEQNA